MTGEVLTVGRAPRRRWRGTPWVIAGAAMLVLTGPGAVVGVEFVTRTAEMNALVDSIERSEAAMVEVQREVEEAFAPYADTEPTPEEQRELREDLADIATRGEAAILAAGIGVADVRVLPWHVRIEEARRAYLEHNAAWVDYMAAAAEDPAEMVRPQPAVNDTFIAAERPLLIAVPRWDPTGVAERILSLYAEDSSDSGSGPQV